jgi:hypothetical protein
VFDRRSKFLSFVTLLQDLVVICIAFGAAYFLRTLLIHFEFFHERLPGIYPFSHYVPLLLGLLARPPPRLPSGGVAEGVHQLLVGLDLVAGVAGGGGAGRRG